MRHARFVVVVAFLSSTAGILIQGCGSGTPTCPAGDVCTADNGGDGGRDIGNPTDGGGGGDSGTLPAGCTDAGAASDDPSCNTCAYANCCKQIDDCANDSTCQAFDNCEAACDPSDIYCLLLCQDEYGPPQTAIDLGTCAQQKCPTECKTPDSGSVDFADAL